VSDKQRHPKLCIAVDERQFTMEDFTGEWDQVRRALEAIDPTWRGALRDDASAELKLEISNMAVLALYQRGDAIGRKEMTTQQAGAWSYRMFDASLPALEALKASTSAPAD